MRRTTSTRDARMLNQSVQVRGSWGGLSRPWRRSEEDDEEAVVVGGQYMPAVGRVALAGNERMSSPRATHSSSAHLGMWLSNQSRR